MSFMENKKNMGPNEEPWGTPFTMNCTSEIFYPTVMYC